MRWAMLGELCRPRQWPILGSKDFIEDGPVPVWGANGIIGKTSKNTHDAPVLLVGCRGTCGSVHITSAKSYANGNAMALDDLDEARCNLRYLAHYLSTRGFQDVISGSSQPQITRQNIVRIKVPLPPLDKQRRIAEILDRADELRTKRRQTLAHLDDLTPSIFHSMFGDPVNPEPGMNVSSVGALASIIVPTRDKPTRFGGDIPWVTLPDLQSMYKIRSSLCVSADSPNVLSNRLIPEHSILLSCAGTVGRVAVTMQPVHANQQFYGIVPKRNLIDATYMAYSLLLRGERYYAQLGGSFTISFFSKEKAKSIPIPVPPLEIQVQFARRVAEVERIRDKVLAHLSELDALCASLRHRAFAGEI